MMLLMVGIFYSTSIYQALNNLALAVTAEAPAGPRAIGKANDDGGRMITVQPLKRSEMQVGFLYGRCENVVF